MESFHLFEEMLNNLNIKVASALTRGQIYMPRPQAPAPQPRETEQGGEEESQTPAPKPQPEVKRAMPEKKNDYSQYRATKEDLPGAAEQRAAASAPQGNQQKTQPVVNGPKVGRNDPCPCGSGKKFKNCHGKGME